MKNGNNSNESSTPKPSLSWRTSKVVETKPAPLVQVTAPPLTATASPLTATASRSVFKLPTTANVVESKAVAAKPASNVVESKALESKAFANVAAAKERYAFAIIHFGSNPVYLELEMYFFKMLRKNTSNDIIYLYSVNDTPQAFVDAIRPLVTEVIPYDDKHITYDVTFNSGYTNFNTLRTCNFIFAYTLKKYNKVCIIESDMVIMRNLDDIFGLQTPAVLTYYIGNVNLKKNEKIRNNPTEVLAKCKEMGRINGGVMLIYPSMTLFNKYKEKIQDVVQHECKYPNETLFEYVNNSYYNLPIQYNLSHYLAKSHTLQQYELTPRDIVIYHFNETKYKHLDIIKNPLDENGDNWLEIIQRNKKYEVKKLPILHYKTTTYDKYRSIIEPIIAALKKKPDSPIPTPSLSPSPPKEEIRPISSLSPPKEEIRPISPLPKSKSKSKSRSKSKSSSKSSSSSSSKSKSNTKAKAKAKVKRPRCPNGTRRNKKTGKCEPI